MKCSAVVAAAGISSRMHEFKPMLCLGEDTMIESVIKNLRKAGVEEIVVVTGYKSDILQRHLKPMAVRSIENPHFTETKMFDSLCLGIRALQEPYDAVFLTPGDVPLVCPKTLLEMESADAEMVRPVCKNRPGHPVLISARLVPQIMQHNGKNGLRGAMESMKEPVLDLPVDDAGVTMDADTPEDFKNLRRQKMENQSGGQLWPDIRIHIAKGDTILTPETAQYLEMIGHTGSIQSACACMHMSYSRGWKLLNHIEKELGYPVVGRYSGGSNGGGSVLTPKGQQLLKAYQNYRSVVRKAADDLFGQIFTVELNTFDGGQKDYANTLSHPSW